MNNIEDTIHSYSRPTLDGRPGISICTYPINTASFGPSTMSLFTPSLIRDMFVPLTAMEPYCGSFQPEEDFPFFPSNQYKSYQDTISDERLKEIEAFAYSLLNEDSIDENDETTLLEMNQELCAFNRREEYDPCYIRMSMNNTFETIYPDCMSIEGRRFYLEDFGFDDDLSDQCAEISPLLIEKHLHVDNIYVSFATVACLTLYPQGINYVHLSYVDLELLRRFLLQTPKHKQKSEDEFLMTLQIVHHAFNNPRSIMFM